MKNTMTVMTAKQTRLQKLWLQIKRHKIIYLFILPCVIWLLVFSYYPMYGALLAFKSYNYNLGILGSPWVGFKNFEEFMKSPDFWIVMKNTVIISGLKIIFGFPAPIILALLLNEVKSKKFKRVVQTMSYLPNFVSWVVVVSLMTVIFTPYGGIINNFRQNMGLGSVFFMGEKAYFYPMVILSDIWKNAGWGSIIYLSALSGVSQELYEAATVDGAGHLKCTWHITLPSIKGTIGIMLIFAVGGILNANFDQILLLQQPANNQISEILDTFVLKTGLNYGRFEYATAIGLFKSVFAFALMALTNTVSKKFMDVGIW
ncbi:ABC transporter permease [Anaerocolumna sp. MB42-C2]|uniref:ABC transporter permease n=1 Tax=Anaerocolumna sp. MB42-C2 TaxID=3070997 RepID=UPI0027E1B6CD|nr:ABC transporter permease subunit [Anaerocolumna sp. MB42-C2]WMJ89924.1 ABC transporter permease subunit [Anaerocolumna sp. MB42-C2]